LRINSETIAARATQNESPRTSWLEGSPIWLSPKLRQRGQHTPRGPARATIDRSAEKAHLRALAEEQARQLEAARQHLLHAGRRRLGELGPLNEPTFRLFLELIGHALTQRTDRAGPIDVESADGTLRIRLEPIPDAAEVALSTALGDFRGHDHWISIEPAVPQTRRLAISQI